MSTPEGNVSPKSITQVDFEVFAMRIACERKRFATLLILATPEPDLLSDLPFLPKIFQMLSLKPSKSVLPKISA